MILSGDLKFSSSSNELYHYKLQKMLLYLEHKNIFHVQDLFIFTSFKVNFSHKLIIICKNFMFYFKFFKVNCFLYSIMLHKIYFINENDSNLKKYKHNNFFKK